MEKAISTHFYAKLTEAYPILKTNAPYAKLMGHILFGTYLCEETSCPVVPARFLASLEGKAYTKGYLSKSFLTAFSHDVMPIQFSNWQYTQQQARTIISFELKKELVSEYVAELKRTRKEKCVLLSSGKVVTQAVRKQIHDELIEQAEQALVLNENQDARYIAEYLNSQSTTLFTQLVNANLDSAIQATHATKNPQYNLNLLADISNVVSKPVYAPSAGKRTPRLFPIQQNLTQLNKSVRRAFLSGCAELDIAHAHFTINAKLWDLKRFAPYMQSCGGDIWQDIITHLGAHGDHDELKAVVKKLVYSIFYGAELAHVKKHAKKVLTHFGVKNGGAKLFKHLLINDVIEARERMLNTIEQNGGAKDIYGNFIMVTDTVSAKSVLAQLTQAVELKIMRSAVELANETDQIKIVAWLHDGVTIHASNAELLKRWAIRMQQTIEQRSNDIGIPVEVDLKML